MLVNKTAINDYIIIQNQKFIHLTQELMSVVWKNSVVRMCNVYWTLKTHFLTVIVLAMMVLTVVVTTVLHIVKVVKTTFKSSRKSKSVIALHIRGGDHER